MVQYAAALSRHPSPVDAVGECVGEILDTLDGDRPDLVVCFATPHHQGAFADMAAGIRKLLEPDTLIGTISTAVAGGRHEVEAGPALSLWAANWGGGRARSVTLDSFPTTDGHRIDGWPDDLATHGTLVLLADPATFPVADFLRIGERHAPGLTIVGGLAASPLAPQGATVDLRAVAARHDRTSQALLAVDDDVRERGAVGVLIDDSVPVRTVVSQGARPIGQPFTITRAEHNLIQELAGQPPLERLRATVAGLSDAEHDLLRHGLHVGLVVDEHRIDFGRGDFLVRNLVGADEATGAIAVGEVVATGQTVQFHVRDAASADEDLAALLAPVVGESALLFTCAGRGRDQFGVADHDVELVQDRLGTVPLAGMACAGEIGPIAGRPFLHGFTASVAVFG